MKVDYLNKYCYQYPQIEGSRFDAFEERIRNAILKSFRELREFQSEEARINAEEVSPINAIAASRVPAVAWNINGLV